MRPCDENGELKEQKEDPSDLLIALMEFIDFAARTRNAPSLSCTDLVDVLAMAQEHTGQGGLTDFYYEFRSTQGAAIKRAFSNRSVLELGVIAQAVDELIKDRCRG